MPKKRKPMTVDDINAVANGVERPVDKLKKKVKVEKQVPFQFYSEASFMKKVKMLSIETDRSIASLVREGLEHVLKKHG